MRLVICFYFIFFCSVSAENQSDKFVKFYLAKKTGQKPSDVPSKKSKRDVEKFEYSGRSIIENISRLSRFLAENRSAYVDVLNNEWNPDPITDITDSGFDFDGKLYLKEFKRPHRYTSWHLMKTWVNGFKSLL